MGIIAVSIGAGICELGGITHPYEIGRDTAAEAGDFRHHIAPQIGRRRVAVQVKKHRLTFAKLDIGHSLAVDPDEFLGVRLAAARHRHLPPVGGVAGAIV